MKKEIPVILIITLLVATAILPAAGNENFDKTDLGEQHFVDEQEVPIAIGDDIDWGSQYQHDPENTGYSTSTAPNTNNVLWTFEDKYEYSMYASAVVVDGRVYTASVGVYVQDPLKTKKDNCSGKVYCLDAETGDLIWQYTSRYGLHATPAVDDGRVYVCSGLWYYENDSVRLIRKGDAFCLDAEDGNVIWEVLDCGYVEGGPVVVDGRIYFASRIYEGKKGYVNCLDCKTGAQIWIRQINSPRGPVAVSDDKVYVGLTEWGDATTEKLVCLNASNGEDIWSWDEGDREEIIAAPTVVDGKVYVATAGYSYGTPNGTTEHVNGAVHCLDAENGDLLWESDIDATFEWSSPAVAYGNVYVGSSGTVGVGLNLGLFGTFYCLNATDGSLVWKRSRLFDILVWLGILPGCYSPAVADGKVYFGSTGRWTANMHCLDAFTGETIWKYKKFTFFRWGSFFSPAIADGKVYAGFESSVEHKAKLYCFADIDPDAPDAPSISGQARGTPGEEYEYTITSTDPNGDDVFYYITWGDGTMGEWIGPYSSGETVTVNHTWSEKGRYDIRARAKDTDGLRGAIGSLKVTMPKSKPFNFNFHLFNWLLERFPILQKILDVLMANLGS